MPAHRALPIALVKNGNPLLPEHSKVKVTSCRGRAFRSASVSAERLPTCPTTSSRQVFGVDLRPLIVGDAEELLIRRDPGIEVLPARQVLDRIPAPAAAPAAADQPRESASRAAPD